MPGYANFELVSSLTVHQERGWALHFAGRLGTHVAPESLGVLHLSQHQDTWDPGEEEPLKDSAHRFTQDMCFSEAALPEASIH